MPYTVIDKGSKYFDTKLYTGTGSTQSIGGLSFKPDWVWIKDRTTAYNHYVYDIIRTPLNVLQTNATDANATQTNGLSAFNSDGFTLLDNRLNVNASGDSFVSWNWLGANTTASNTQGSITSTVSASQTSGFSIVSYTGNGSSSATVGHGLGVTPSMIICKGSSYANSWFVYHKSLSANNFVYLNYTDAQANANTTNGGCLSTSPTSSTFGFQSGTSSVNNVNTNGNTYIAYCFTDVKGFSKFGSYTGNGSTDGTFVYCGFRPSYVLVKYISGTGQDWYIWDNKRVTYNPNNNIQTTNTNQADTITSVVDLDILSNGFKCRNTNGGYNSSGGTYIYMAFAENPFVSSKAIPCTAK